MSHLIVSKVISKKKDEILRSINKLFKDIIEDYFPGGFFKWEDYAKELSDKFYFLASSIVKRYLPKKLFYKIKDLDLPQIFSESDLKINKELIDRIVLDSLLHINDNPSLLEEYLIRSYYNKKDDEEDLKIGEVFFIPKIGHDEIKEVREDHPDAKVGELDSRVLDNLEGKKEIEWEWKGIDENGFLKFILPKLYGEREFRVKLPKEVPVIKPGKYTFIVKKVIPSRGALLILKEQKEDIKKNSLKFIARTGFGKDQLLNFINKVIIGYLNEYITKRSVSKILEDLAGMITIKDKDIYSVEDLAELAGFGEDEIEGVKRKKLKKEEEVKTEYKKFLEEEQEKLQQIFNTWFKAPEVAKYFSSHEKDSLDKVIKALVSKFPEESERPELGSIIKTRPVVEEVLKIILAPNLPMTLIEKSNWISLAWDKFKDLVFKNSKIKEKIINLIKGKNVNLVVSNKDIEDFLNSLSRESIKKLFYSLRDEIASIIDKAEKTGEIPELKSFYDYRRTFKDYAQKVLLPYIIDYMEEHKIRLKDEDKIKKIFENLLSDVMKGKKSIRYLYEKLEEGKRKKLIKEDKKKKLEDLEEEGLGKYSYNYIINSFIRQCMLNLRERGILN